jgi:hypothetical protein
MSLENFVADHIAEHHEFMLKLAEVKKELQARQMGNDLSGHATSPQPHVLVTYKPTSLKCRHCGIEFSKAK